VVRRLHEHGISFTVASSRPPRGLTQFAEALGLSEPFAAFNGAVIQRADGETLVKHVIPRAVGERIVKTGERFGVETWVYCDHEWHVARRTPFVEREERTIGFAAVVEANIRELLDNAAKLTLVGDPALVAEAELVVLAEVGSEVSATKSKPRFLDITDARAHKGTVVTQLSEVLGISIENIAVIGDGLNDILMFERAGLSIAMGQAGEAVRAAADVVTAANTEEGFARAMEKFILGEHESAERPLRKLRA
jgi:hypothetical protein